ncbi:toll/interleukin-1 receptor domain-containing protein [Cohnella panacarvi]|uniref:toll/interleukin-1 receptor domain-containing protein n=1 Tax=Cohnella panacarvi TaxID=400776 RepID=UPI00146F9CC6|nr:toll/interleukin-1 receptor domain-containing protein [Cohnella panacarvi]
MKRYTVPTVFISYCWTSEEHKKWVKDLASRLRQDGIDAFIDEWRLKPGQDRFAFMEAAITSEHTTKVLVICDENYKLKADRREGGVGIESQIISSKTFTKVDQRKFIPIISQRSNTGDVYIPTYMEHMIYIDLSSTVLFESGYKQLIYAIYETSEHEEPPLGDAPDYVIAKLQNVERVSGSSSKEQIIPLGIKESQYFNQMYVSDDKSHKHNGKLISLNSFLPNQHDLGSCLFLFSRQDLAGCMITMHGRNLIETLFRGLNTNSKDCKRGFLVGYNENNDTYSVQFPNNRFLLNSAEAEELCLIVDNFYPAYIKAFRKYNQAKSTIVSDVRQLHDVAQDIQSFYTIFDSFTPGHTVKGLYEALRTALFRSKLSNSVFGYIGSKLPIKGLTEENICIKIKERQDSLSADFYHNGEVDMILRSLVVLLRDCKSSLSLAEIEDISKKLQPMEDMKDLFDNDLIAY